MPTLLLGTSGTFTDIEYGVGFGAFANIVIVLYYTARPAFIVESSSKTRVIKIGGSVCVHV